MGCCASRERTSRDVPYEHPPHLRSSLKGGIGPAGPDSPKVNANVSFDEARNQRFEFDPDYDGYGGEDARGEAGDGSFTCPKCTAAVAADDDACPGCRTSAAELKRLNQQAGVKRRLSVSGIKLAQKQGKN